MRQVPWMLFAASALVAGCAHTDPNAAGPVDAQASPEEVFEADLDPWNLTISAERYGVLLNRAIEGVIIGPPARTLPEVTDQSLLQRAGWATRDAAFSLYQLQKMTCEHGLVGVDDCLHIEAPDWLDDSPTSIPTPEEIHLRIRWLVDHLGPHLEAGCDAGQSRNTEPDGWPHFCSTE